MIVYENLGNMTAKKILEEYGDELRTEPWLLLYEPTGETEVWLSNTFDISDITVRQCGEHITTVYANPGQIDERLKELSERLFGNGFETHPYREWLARQRQADDEEKTLKELYKFLNSCKHRALSSSCKERIKALVQTV